MRFGVYFFGVGGHQSLLQIPTCKTIFGNLEGAMITYIQLEQTLYDIVLS